MPMPDIIVPEVLGFIVAVVMALLLGPSLPAQATLATGTRTELILRKTG